MESVAREHWSQVSIETERSPDESMLAETWAPVLTEIRPHLRGWHFFWEPDLWIRLRWLSAQDRAAGHEKIRATLEAPAWRFDTYAWEDDAAMMGAEMWDRCQADWMGGSDYALQHLTLARAGSVSKTRDFHWARHVHLFTNQLAGTWSDEARLCVRQARYRIWLLSRTAGNEAERPALEALVAKLDDVLAGHELLATCESRFVDAWRDGGRPSIVEGLDLPPGFAEERASDGVVER